MTPEEALAFAQAGAAAGCQEALFTLGDRPERLRFTTMACFSHVCSTTLSRRNCSRAQLMETSSPPALS